MSDAPENLVLGMLRTIRQTQLEQGLRLTPIGIGITRIRREVAGDAESATITASRIDALTERPERLEQAQASKP